MQSYIKLIRDTKTSWFETIWPALSFTATQLSQVIFRDGDFKNNPCRKRGIEKKLFLCPSQ